MTKWRKIAYVIYPFLIGFLIPALVFMFDRPDANAGTIRRAELSPDRPLIVRLALGRTTAISFSTKPENVVPGSPDALEIHFLKQDLTIRPLGVKPGNLIVYTKNNRYVILLQITSEAAYDDAITISTGLSNTRPIRLVDDTFTIGEVKITNPKSKKESSFNVLVKQNGKLLESDAFPAGLRCTGCVLKKQKPMDQLLCAHPVQSLDCKIGPDALHVERHSIESSED